MSIQSKIMEAVDQAAEIVGCASSEFDGWTLRQIFTDLERDHVTIYWGCWSDTELDTPIQSALDDHEEFNQHFEALRVAAGPHNPLSLDVADC